jgi:AcrR family transcriptional regulator
MTRAYTLGRRQLAADETRARILAAARDLLADEDGPPGFTVEAVARQAGVARMTVYHQFESKRAVLEALFDHLAERSLVPYLRLVFQEATADAALTRLIAAFVGFWNAERMVLRRARALAALDVEIGESVRDRDERRREHLRRLLSRLSVERGLAPAASLGVAVDILHALTSFETFDALRRGARTQEAVTEIICALAATAIEPPPHRRTLLLPSGDKTAGRG